MRHQPESCHRFDAGIRWEISYLESFGSGWEPETAPYVPHPFFGGKCLRNGYAINIVHAIVELSDYGHLELHKVQPRA